MLRQRFVTFFSLRRLKSSRSKTSGRPVSSAKRIRPPHNVSLKGNSKHSSQYYNNEGNATGMGPRLYDYQVTGDIVRSIPNAAHRIDFVNPHEREWTRREQRFHRPWLHKLLATRKAWAVRSVPVYFDSLNFYQYITKMKLIEGIDWLYETDFEVPTTSFMDRLHETLRFHLHATNLETEGERTTRILRSLMDMLIEYLVETHNYSDLSNMRVSYTPRCESFWIRSGFESLYDKNNRFRIRGDHRAKLGELAFTLRDTFAAHVRSSKQLKPLVSISDPLANSKLFDESVDVVNDVIFSPSIYGLHADADPLWQCPGFEPDCGEDNKYGVVAFKECNSLNDLCKYWNMKGVEEKIVRDECFRATAIASLFSWLNAQAHSNGHTQYNDIEKPIVSQIVVSDGKQFLFAVAQLNTLQINADFQGLTNDRTNFCFTEGPLNLYEEYDAVAKKFYHRASGVDTLREGVNPRVIIRIMQMLVRDLQKSLQTSDTDGNAYSKYKTIDYDFF